jgi:hypothetical protein
VSEGEARFIKGVVVRAAFLPLLERGMTRFDLPEGLRLYTQLLQAGGAATSKSSEV